MQVLNPLALLLIPLVLVVLLLVRRQRVRTRRVVTAPFLWEAATAPVTPLRTPRLSPRRRWLLLVQALLMLALVLALARPLLTLGRPAVDFLIDTSGSMGARDAGGSRLDMARAAALAAARALPARTRIRVWTTNTEAPRDTDIGGLTRTLAGVGLSDGPARLDRHLEAIRAAHGDAPLFVFTDTTQPPSSGPGLRWTTVGHGTDNVAVVALAGRQRTGEQAATELVVGLRNFGGQTVAVPYEVRQAERVLAAGQLEVAARAETTVALRVPRVTGVVTARALRRDALDADNVRFAVIPDASPTRALLLTSGSFFLEQALASQPGMTLDVRDPAQADLSRRYDVVICDACDAAPAGVPALLVSPGGSNGAPAPVRVTLRGHPLARFLESTPGAAIPVADARPVDEQAVIATIGDAPAILADESGGHRVVQIRMRLAESPFVLNPGFPVLIANALDWLTRRNENPSELSAGEALRWTLPEGDATRVVVRDTTDGRLVSSAMRQDALATGPLERAGSYEVEAGSGRRSFVVNPATESESDLTMPAAVPAAAPAPVVAAGATPFDARAVLLALTLLLLVVEGVMSTPLQSQALLVRGVIAAAILAGIFAPPIPWGSAPLQVMFVLDRSGSTGAAGQRQALDRINAATATMRADDRAGVIVFGADAAIEQPLGATVRVGARTAKVSGAATDIEGAIRLARLVLGTGGARRAVLISDGNQTIGDAGRELAAAAVAGIPIDVAAVDPAAGRMRTLSVESVSAPPVVRAGEPFAVSVSVRGPAGAGGQVDLARDGVPVASIPVVVREHGMATAEWTDADRTSAIHTYTASLTSPVIPEEPAPAGTVVTVSGRPAALYVSAGGLTLAPLLTASQWQVTIASSLPGARSALLPFDAVILEDVTTDGLSTAQRDALAQYVERDGGGLLVIGSPSSLRTYAAASLSRLLPVDLRPPNGRRGPGMALVLAFDKSGSMADAVSGVTKIELARQSVIGALQAIPPTDLFGVLAFDAKPTVVTPLASATDAAAIAARLRILEASGATSIAPAIDLAEAWLSSTDVARKRVLLVSDGRTGAADVERLRTAARSHRFELSVVAIGNDADRPLLTALATESGGRAYFPEDVSQLPAIVARDAAEASGGSVVSETFTARLQPHAVTRGFDPVHPPVLSGYVVGTAKPAAEVMLSSHLGDPLLAGWRAGLGRVALFTSDLRSPWTASFRGWTGAGVLWAQTVRWIGRRADAAGTRLRLEATTAGVRVLLSAEPAIGDHRLVRATASVRGPSGDVVLLPLRPTAPGQFEKTVAAAGDGTYVVSVEAERADGEADRMTQGVYWAAAVERPEAPNTALLSAIADTTGGRILQPGDSPFAGPRPGQPTDVRWLFALVALVTFMLDLLWRRGVLSAPRRASRIRHTASPQAAA